MTENYMYYIDLMLNKSKYYSIETVEATLINYVCDEFKRPLFIIMLGGDILAFIDTQLITFKNMIEDSIRTGGVKGKESMIRSSALIKLVHNAVKFELQAQIVDFRANVPKIFRSSDELRSAGLISNNFPIEYKNLNFDNFAENILNIYSQRYNIKNLMC